MKKLIGVWIGSIGAYLCDKRVWTGDERYEDLTVMDKLGYRMICRGLTMMGVTIEDIERLAKNL